MEKGARPQRDRKRKSYADIADGDGDAGGLLAVEREALGGGPKRGPGRPPGVRNGDGKPRRRTSGQRPSNRARPTTTAGRQAASKMYSQPLRRTSEIAWEWGFKHVLQAGEPHNPLYYGCPEPAEYFCCERHALLWRGGALQMELMPDAWKESAPDPEDVEQRAAEADAKVRAAEEAAAERAEAGGGRGAAGAAAAEEEEEGEGEGEEEDGEGDGEAGEAGDEGEEAGEEEGEEGEEAADDDADDETAAAAAAAADGPHAGAARRAWQGETRRG